ncbi:transcription cofactor HES-6-like [Clarias gariepinus]|uniref:transcription cofactor HES-6-like n=1 Tax=Clarias gariepinus TaxID=13013 RepID=UPI00234C46AF|nr:transcription cofactor HES-6-like [Clarias gariepinus]
MAFTSRAGHLGSWAPDEEECRGDRRTRKPLVEKKRRARINESLHELRGLLSDAELHAKMENAEVLELTVRRVESILQDRSHETDSMSREASERFASGYIQCMHEVHTFVSTCPGIESTVAAELLNHLLECMPLHEDLQDVIIDLGSELLSPTGTWPRIGSPGSHLSPSSSTGGAEEDPSSDLEETFSSESAPGSAEEEEQEEEEQEDRSTGVSEHRHPYCTSMWRPW